MRIEFKKYKHEAVLIDDTYAVVRSNNDSGRAKAKRNAKPILVSNGRVAFEILGHGQLRDKLHAEYEEKQRRVAAPAKVLVVPKPEPVRAHKIEGPKGQGA